MNSESKRVRLISWLDLHYISLLTLFLLLMYGVKYFAIGPDPIRSDGAGYYAYLPSYVLYADPSYETDARIRYDGEFPRWTYVREYPPTGRYLNAYNMGVALFILPFFLIAHFLTIWFGFPWGGGWEFMQMRYPLDGYSFFYQHAAGLAGLFYAVVGFAFLKAVSKRHFSAGVVMAALMALLLGTNLLYYASLFTVNAHPYTFFLSALLIYVTDRWYKEPERGAWIVGLGLVVGLLYLVRPVNLAMALWIPLYALTSVGDLEDRIRFFWSHRFRILIMMGLAFLCILPQMFIWRYATGSFFISSYQHLDSSHFGMPDIIGVLFGIDKGMLTWFPIAAFGFWGFYCLWRTKPEYLMSSLVTSLVVLLIAASYLNWRTAGGFGNRYVVDVFAFTAFPMAAFYAHWQKAWARGVIAMISCLFIVWNLFLLTLLLRREMGYYGLEAQAWFDIFWWRKHAFMDWWNAL